MVILKTECYVWILHHVRYIWRLSPAVISDYVTISNSVVAHVLSDILMTENYLLYILQF
jgi:hypothetical protein